MPTYVIPDAVPFQGYRQTKRNNEDNATFRDSPMYVLIGVPGVWRCLKGHCTVWQADIDGHHKALIPAIDGNKRLSWFREIPIPVGVETETEAVFEHTKAGKQELTPGILGNGEKPPF
tara:strand:- start:71 stop:424 length:354 start_codon:yes stop_codon:yes gene_type:complete